MNIDTHGLLTLTADDLIGQSVAILGIKGSGKSNTAAVLIEELLTAGVPICVVDIAGEYHTLRDQFPHVAVIGRGLHHDVQIKLTTANTAQIAETAYRHGSPVVLDISGVPSDLREGVLLDYFRAIWPLAAVHRIPLVIFLEEAHNWIPQTGKTAVSDLFIDIAAEGRKRGLSLVMVGQRSTRIHKDTLTQADIAFLHRVRHPTDLKVYIEMIPRLPRKVRDMVNELRVGQALVLMDERVLRCQIRPRHTMHVGYTPSLADVPKQLPLLKALE